MHCSMRGSGTRVSDIRCECYHSAVCTLRDGNQLVSYTENVFDDLWKRSGSEDPIMGLSLDQGCSGGLPSSCP